MEQYNVPGGSIFGHTAVPGVFAVGAINASDDGLNTIAPYSSRGPSRIDYPSPSLIPKPDVASIDGVSVTGAGGFSTTFYGTSAAAPHVAGIAALLQSVGATSNQVKQALVSGSVDLGAIGRDLTFGHGRTDALEAFKFFDADLDGVLNTRDNCPSNINSSQADFDTDGLGDACDADDDNDGVSDVQDAFPLDPNESTDTDSDGIGNNADPDDDNDGLSDEDEREIYGTNPLRRDSDGDGLADDQELAMGLDPLDSGDCPDELCPSSSSLTKFLPIILQKHQAESEQR
jgi:subtilisin family serine protease